MDRCLREIADARALLLAGHPDVEGLCRALADWSAELRLIQRERETQQRKPATAKAGRALEGERCYLLIR